jgi:hypothetical protein
MLTNNYKVLSKPFTSQGCYVHTASSTEYMNVTIQRCNNEGESVRVCDSVEAEFVNVRVDVGKTEISLYYKFKRDLDTFTITNIPMYERDEAWIAIDAINQFCVFGHSCKGIELRAKGK